MNISFEAEEAESVYESVDHLELKEAATKEILSNNECWQTSVNVPAVQQVEMYNRVNQQCLSIIWVKLNIEKHVLIKEGQPMTAQCIDQSSVIQG